MSIDAVSVGIENAKTDGPVTLPEKLVADGNPASQSWVSSEISVKGKMRSGIWAGEVGTIKIGSYPTDEVFTVIEGQIDLVNEDGSVIEVKVGQSALMPKGWSGLFRIVERARKCFVAVGD